MPVIWVSKVKQFLKHKILLLTFISVNCDNTVHAEYYTMTIHMKFKRVVLMLLFPAERCILGWFKCLIRMPPVPDICLWRSSDVDSGLAG